MIDLPQLPVVESAFVIYDPKRELYSRGGDCPSWSKKPKMWSGWGPLKNHLAMFIGVNYVGEASSYLDRKKAYTLTRSQPYGDQCVIFDIVTNSYVSTVADVYKKMILARQKKDQKDQDKRINEMIAKIKRMNDNA